MTSDIMRGSGPDLFSCWAVVNHPFVVSIGIDGAMGSVASKSSAVLAERVIAAPPEPAVIASGDGVPLLALGSYIPGSTRRMLTWKRRP